MASVLRLQEHGEPPDGQQAIATLRRGRSLGGPLARAVGRDEHIAMRYGEPDEVAKQRLVRPTLEAERSLECEVPVDACAQHDFAPGQGSARAASIVWSTLA